MKRLDRYHERMSYKILNGLVDSGFPSACLPNLCIWCKQARFEKVDGKCDQLAPVCFSFRSLFRDLTHRGILSWNEKVFYDGIDCSYFVPRVTREEAVDETGRQLQIEAAKVGKL